MFAKSDYNPITCFTAKELRAMGHGIPSHIPDCAWVNKSSCEIKPGGPFNGVNVNSDGSWSMGFELVIHAPFRWIEVDTIVQKKV